MTRGQVAVLVGVLAAIVLGLASMSTASVTQVQQPLQQTIAEPFCATSEPRVSLQSATVVKRGMDLTSTWQLSSIPASRVALKVDLASSDFKYNWSVFAVVDGGAVVQVATLDTVSNQLVGYDVAGSAVTSRVIGDSVEVSAPLPGAPDTFSWFAAAGLGAAGQQDLRTLEFASFCPAGWLAQYPPSA